MYAGRNENRIYTCQIGAANVMAERIPDHQHSFRPRPGFRQTGVVGDLVRLAEMRTPPQTAAFALEIPAVVKQRLGLDFERSWIVLSEGNEFTWPGPDLRPQPGADLSSVAYGFLPPRLFGEILKRFIALGKTGLASKVPRTE